MGHCVSASPMLMPHERTPCLSIVPASAVLGYLCYSVQDCYCPGAPSHRIDRPLLYLSSAKLKAMWQRCNIISSLGGVLIIASKPRLTSVTFFGWFWRYATREYPKWSIILYGTPCLAFVWAFMVHSCKDRPYHLYTRILWWASKQLQAMFRLVRCRLHFLLPAPSTETILLMPYFFFSIRGS